MFIDPVESSGTFNIKVLPDSFSTIKVFARPDGCLKIHGTVTAEGGGANRILFRLLPEIDKPKDKTKIGKAKKHIRKKARIKKKFSDSFQVAYNTWDRSVFLLVFDNNNSRYAKNVEINVEIEGTPPSPGEHAINGQTRSDSMHAVHDRTRKRILGVLKSFQSISMSDLTKHSNLSEDETRNIVFEMIAEDMVSGRFDSSTDSFISASAASASREIRSEQQSIAQCMYCGKPLEKALKSGDEIPCPSCGIINIG